MKRLFLLAFLIVVVTAISALAHPIQDHVSKQAPDLAASLFHTSFRK
jgi:hypothetical protein